MMPNSYSVASSIGRSARGASSDRVFDHLEAWYAIGCMLFAPSTHQPPDVVEHGGVCGRM